MTAKIIQLPLPFAPAASPPPKRHARQATKLMKGRIPDDADLDVLFQYMIQAQLQAMRDRALARYGGDDHGKGKVNYEGRVPCLLIS